ncbi:hypothetical protein AB0H12_02025 [Actinosynnema sp. NPDC023794]
MTDVVRVSAPEAPVLDVVFLHGLGGNARTTWSAGEAFWPGWLGADVPGVGVWSVGYDASPSGWLGRAMPIQDRAVNVLARLQNEGVGERPLVFVTHSMGGLLAKQVLLHAEGSPAYRSFAEAARGVVFLATPHTGADMAGYLKRLGLGLRLTAAVADLEPNSAYLRDLNVRYRDWAHRSGARNLVFFEAHTTRGVRIVDAGSADPGLVGAGPIPVDADHFAICKPADRDALVYGQVRRFLAGIRDALPADAPTRESTPTPSTPTPDEPAASAVYTSKQIAGRVGDLLRQFDRDQRRFHVDSAARAAAHRFAIPELDPDEKIIGLVDCWESTVQDWFNGVKPNSFYLFTDTALHYSGYLHTSKGYYRGEEIVRIRLPYARMGEFSFTHRSAGAPSVRRPPSNWIEMTSASGTTRLILFGWSAKEYRRVANLLQNISDFVSGR